MKYNLGSGDIKLVDYESIDIKQGKNVYPLDIPDDSADEIRASHILEHFGQGRKAFDVLTNWVSKLKPGCWIKIAVPDFRKCIEPYNRKQKTNMADYIMGGQVDEWDYHKSIYDKEALTTMMSAAGLVDLQLWKSGISDCASLPISLNIMGQKPVGGIKKAGPKIRAVMSMPRLAFTDNMFCAMQVLLRELQIPLSRSVGVWWDQCLTRQMENHLDDGTEYILTLDYDTWFTKEHVVKLIRLMQDNPDVDALIPVQQRREEDSMLLAVDGTEEQSNQAEIRVPFSEFQKPLMKAGTGHFGLTLFRVSALNKLEKPWFLPVPGPDLSWNVGRLDPDIYFWNQFNRQGFKACQANEVFVGHLQMMCTWPDRFPTEPGQQQRSIHQYMGHLQKHGPPIHCVPNVDY